MTDPHVKGQPTDTITKGRGRPRVVTKSQGGGLSVGTYLSTDQFDLLQKRAAAEGRSISDFVRHAVVIRLS